MLTSYNIDKLIHNLESRSKYCGSFDLYGQKNDYCIIDVEQDKESSEIGPSECVSRIVKTVLWNLNSVSQYGSYYSSYNHNMDIAQMETGFDSIHTMVNIKFTTIIDEIVYTISALISKLIWLVMITKSSINPTL